MTILYMIKKGNKKFYICKWDSGMYSIDRITKGFGGSVVVKQTIEEIEEYAKQMDIRKFHKPKRSSERQPWDGLPALMMADQKRRVRQ